MAEQWLQLLSKAEECGSWIAKACLNILGAIASWEELLTKWRSSSHEMQPIAEAFDDVAAMCRCFLVLLGDSSMTNPHQVNPASFVFAFSDYKGKDLFRRTFRNVIRESTFWQQQSVEVTRTAASVTLLKPDMQALLKLMDELDEEPDKIDHERLSAVASGLVKVKAGVREVQFKPLRDKAVALTVKIAKGMTQTASLSNVNKHLVESCAHLLTMFADVEGVLTVSQDFDKWANSVKSQMNVQSLLELFLASDPDNIDCEKVSKMLPSAPVNLDLPSQVALQSAAAKFLQNVIQHVLSEARGRGGRWVRGGGESPSRPNI